jgi:hypothetical protein
MFSPCLFSIAVQANSAHRLALFILLYMPWSDLDYHFLFRPDDF